MSQQRILRAAAGAAARDAAHGTGDARRRGVCEGLVRGARCVHDFSPPTGGATRRRRRASASVAPALEPPPDAGAVRPGLRRTPPLRDGPPPLPAASAHPPLRRRRAPAVASVAWSPRLRTARSGARGLPPSVQHAPPASHRLLSAAPAAAAAAAAPDVQLLEPASRPRTSPETSTSAHPGRARRRSARATRRFDGPALPRSGRLLETASDLHIAVGARADVPRRRRPAPAAAPSLEPRRKVTGALRASSTDRQRETSTRDLELDIAYTISANARFRVNMYQQRGAIGAAFRLIPTEIK